MYTIELSYTGVPYYLFICISSFPEAAVYPHIASRNCCKQTVNNNSLCCQYPQTPQYGTTPCLSNTTTLAHSHRIYGELRQCRRCRKLQLLHRHRRKHFVYKWPFVSIMYLVWYRNVSAARGLWNDLGRIKAHLKQSKVWFVDCKVQSAGSERCYRSVLNGNPIHQISAALTTFTVSLAFICGSRSVWEPPMSVLERKCFRPFGSVAAGWFESRGYS